MNTDKSVRIVEVGPRDGLQNEPEHVPTSCKAAFVQRLAAAGLREIEATAFVHPRAVPQLADAPDLLGQLDLPHDVRVSALCPNLKGLERAHAAGVQRIAVFTGASETFVQRNIKMTIAESLETFGAVISAARTQAITVRGYVSTAFFCPYDGPISPPTAIEVTNRLLDLGCDEVAVSDTIGAATPPDIEAVMAPLLDEHPTSRLALHLHDTYGTALANVVAGLRLGIRTFDASAGGLGGCPYAPGASGNLATEDLVYLLDQMGYQTGVSLEGVAAASDVIAKHFQRRLPSRNWQRLRACD